MSPEQGWWAEALAIERMRGKGATAWVARRIGELAAAGDMAGVALAGDCGYAGRVNGSKAGVRIVDRRFLTGAVVALALAGLVIALLE